MTDYIKREDAINEIRKDIMGGLNYEGILKRLPSADVVERKRGKWIKGETWSEGYGMGEQYGRYYTCSECSHTVQSDYGKSLINFCPKCGADMRGE